MRWNSNQETVMLTVDHLAKGSQGWSLLSTEAELIPFIMELIGSNYFLGTPGNLFSSQHFRALETCGLASLWSLVPIRVGLYHLGCDVVWPRHWGAAGGRRTRALSLGVTLSQWSPDLNCFVFAGLGIFQTRLHPAILVASCHICWSPFTLFCKNVELGDWHNLM